MGPASDSPLSDSTGNGAHVDKLLPSAIDAEEAVLAVLMVDALPLDRLGLQAGDFYAPPQRMIYGAIVQLSAEGNPTDPVTLGHHLEAHGQLDRVGGQLYLQGILNGNMLAGIRLDHHAGIIRECAARRRMIQLGLNIQTVGYDMALPLGQATTLAKRVMAEAEARVVGPRPSRVCFGDLQEESADWIWRGRIPRGMVTMLDGDPGVGKSGLTRFIAAAYSVGGVLPDHGPVEQATSIFAIAEDSLSHVVLGKLNALGADTNRIHAITGIQARAGDEEDALVLTPEGLRMLDQAIEETSALIAFIDPITAYLGGGIDMYRPNEVRPIMRELARIAERRNCAVVVVRHMNKGGGTNPLYRGLGSIDFAAAARSMLLMGADPKDEHRRIVAHHKCNVGPPSRSLAFSFGSEGVLSFVDEEVDLTAADLLAGPREPAESAMSAACLWLREKLKNGQLPATELKAAAAEAKISPITLRRAKDELDIVSGQRRTEDGKRVLEWVWKLPSQEARDCLGAQEDYLEHVGQSAKVGQADFPHKYAKTASDSLGAHGRWEKEDEHVENPCPEGGRGNGHISPCYTCHGTTFHLVGERPICSTCHP